VGWRSVAKTLEKRVNAEVMAHSPTWTSTVSRRVAIDNTDQEPLEPRLTGPQPTTTHTPPLSFS
jgi:hypothetical protein